MSRFTTAVRSRTSNPDLNQPSLILSLPDYLFPTDPATFFPARKPIELEIGTGDGGFLAQWADFNRESNFLGIERLLGRLRKLDRKGRRLGLKNLRLLRVEASYYLRYLTPPGSLRAIHVYFPDPWPKRKHQKNRLINEEFPRLASRCLQPGGVVYLRTDDKTYFQRMSEIFDRATDFVATETPSAVVEVLTDFERGFLAQGLQTQRAAYQRK